MNTQTHDTALSAAAELAAGVTIVVAVILAVGAGWLEGRFDPREAFPTHSFVEGVRHAGHHRN